jgi:2-polyprenyl-3-methyl-5-hydroxy-6-metoxy-1,4-benzoquinol methylase
MILGPKMIDKIPFFYKCQVSKNNGGLPTSYPFDLYFDKDLKMYRQRATPELSQLLEQIYTKGSLADGSMSSESGAGYVKKVADYIESHSSATPDSKIFEIGFGSGILLKELKQRGYKNLFGIEPGSHERLKDLDGIELIKDFYPSGQLKSKMDLIYSFAILEHIEDPLKFIQQQISQLNDGGRIIFSVPNCEPYIQSGDLSMFIHEHFNYFTAESITTLIEKTDFKIEDLSIIDGAIIVTISKLRSKQNQEFISTRPSDFEKKVELHLTRLKSILNKYHPQQVAVYAPIRAMNALFLTNNTEVRLVDDNSEIHGKYLPGFSASIESFDSMTLNPPQVLLIFSRTFGTKIKSKCASEPKLSNTLILTLDDLDALKT